MGRSATMLATLAVAVVAGTNAIGCNAESEPTALSVGDATQPEAQIRNLIGQLPRLVDGRHWSAIEEHYDEQVTSDYSSLFGGKPEIATGRSLINDWRLALSPLDATQHLLGPIDVRVNSNYATARCHVRAWHFLENASGGNEWMVAGSYDFGLRQTPNGWKINTMRLNTYYQTGNADILKEAKEMNRRQ